MSIKGIRERIKQHGFTVLRGKNGLPYVAFHTVSNGCIHISLKNAKTGKVFAFNLPVELTCKHDCECYSEKNCYACGGCYMFHINQAMYAENLHYWRTHTTEEFVEEIAKIIESHPTWTLYRWFTCGDIPNTRFVDAMVMLAERLPNIRFWTYTKKYMIVNDYVYKNDLESIPDNLHIIFSHWMNDDGSYYPMLNPYNFPTSEFIPYGREDLIKTVDHLCPCSNPLVHETCATCSTPCYELKHGMSMGLVEHSTPRTRARDLVIKSFMAIAGKAFDLIDFLTRGYKEYIKK